MRNIFFMVITLVVVFSFTAMGQVSGTKHDLSASGPGTKSETTELCVFCHTPHQQAGGYDMLLWNRDTTVNTSFAVYSSSTIDASPAPAAVDKTTGTSILCLSCHDGTVALDAINNDSNEDPIGTLTPGGNVTVGLLISGEQNLGNTLADDHPVNFNYDAALVLADTGLADPTSSPIVDWLEAGKVQCSSCHDPHTQNETFLNVATNANSALCTTCHTNK